MPVSRPVLAPHRSRRARTAVAAVVATALLAACGGGADDEADGSGVGDDGSTDQVQIRFSWFGDADRHELNQEVIALFEEQHPEIDVVPDYSHWDGYWERIATTLEAGAPPDVMVQEERFLRDYGSRGALLDLEDHLDTIDLAAHDPVLGDSGVFGGGRYAVPAGIVAPGVMVHTGVFADAGVKVPDGAGWSWEDFAAVAERVSAGTPDDVWGAQEFGSTGWAFAVFARQQGEGLFTGGGDLAFTEATLTEWFAISAAMRASGATPPPAESIALRTDASTDLLATGRTGMAMAWTSRLEDVQESSGQDVQMLPLPGEAQAEQPGMYVRPTQYYAIAAASEHPEEAATLVDFLLNDVDAARLYLGDRGLPVNTEVRTAILEDLSDADQEAVAYLERIAPGIADTLPTPPSRALDIQELLHQYHDQVMLGELLVKEGPPRFFAAVGRL